MSKTDDLRWVEACRPLRSGSKEWPQAACIDSSGVVYAPARLVGDETTAMLCACWDDDVETVVVDGHIYLPIEWLATYCPERAAACVLVERKVKAYFAKEEKA